MHLGPCPGFSRGVIILLRKNESPLQYPHIWAMRHWDRLTDRHWPPTGAVSHYGGGERDLREARERRLSVTIQLLMDQVTFWWVTSVLNNVECCFVNIMYVFTYTDNSSYGYLCCPQELAMTMIAVSRFSSGPHRQPTPLENALYFVWRSSKFQKRVRRLRNADQRIWKCFLNIMAYNPHWNF